jgi:hypothetical protein
MDGTVPPSWHIAENRNSVTYMKAVGHQGVLISVFKITSHKYIIEI